jgi:hypothetical protein
LGALTNRLHEAGSPRDIGRDTAADWRLRCTLHQKVVRNGGKSAAKQLSELASGDATAAPKKI